MKAMNWIKRLFSKAEPPPPIDHALIEKILVIAYNEHLIHAYMESIKKRTLFQGDNLQLRWDTELEIRTFEGCDHKTWDVQIMHQSRVIAGFTFNPETEEHEVYYVFRQIEA